MSVFVTTANCFEGYRITDYLGIARGIIVRSPTISQGILGGLKSIVGGNIDSYRKVCESGREQAYEAMVQHARELGANAVIGMRYDTEQIGPESSAATGVLCYGTAVKIEEIA